MTDNNDKPEGITSGAAIETSIKHKGAFWSAAMTNISSAHKILADQLARELYGFWHNVPNAKEELISRVKSMSKVEKAFLNIEE